MLRVLVLALIVLASAGLTSWSWRKLRALELRATGEPALRAWTVVLYSALPVLISAAVLTWRHSLSGRSAVEFFVAYSAVAYPLLLWIGYLLMRTTRPSSGRGRR